MACSPSFPPQPHAKLPLGIGLPGSGGHFGAGFPIGTVSQSSRIGGEGEVSLCLELKRNNEERAGSRVALFVPGIPAQHAVPLPDARPRTTSS